MKIQKVSEVLGKRVFTDSGDFFGEVEEANLKDNRIDGWRIRVSGGVLPMIGGARGVIIPHHFVKAIQDVFIINRAALPSPTSGIDMTGLETE
jgi:sporulation protein YlmC with PRC-barrel domain